MTKQVVNYTDAEKDILDAVAMLAEPIKQTLGPKGGNVIIQGSKGETYYTNDGVTIAKEISSSDPIKDSVIEIVKQASLKTNSLAGDGTSTTILLADVLIREGFRMLHDGMNHMDIVEKLEKMRDELLDGLKSQKIEIRGDEDLYNIAKISSNNNDEIAQNVVDTIKTAGEDGLVFLEYNNSTETKIVEDVGFFMDTGMFHPELSVSSGTTTMQNVPLLITDKRLYYPEEAERVLHTCLENGYKEVVIVASDFIGEALPFFLANHKKGIIKVLLIKEEMLAKDGGETMRDLAIFTGGKIVSDSTGSIVDNLTIDDFVIVDKVYADMGTSLISRFADDDRTELDERIEMLKGKRDELEEGDEKEEIKRRIASLTNGLVTIKIGGATGPEIAEKRFRYEDAISAVRAAIKDGFLIGGGMAIMDAAQSMDRNQLIEKYTTANLRQLVTNSGMSFDYVLSQLPNTDEGYGFNAKTGKVEKLLESGVIDPYKVTELAIINSVSIASAILSSRYMVVNEEENDGK